MYIIRKKPFLNASKRFQNDAALIKYLYKTLKNGTFLTPEELNTVFPSLVKNRYREKWWGINFGANNLQLLAFIDFKYNMIYVKHIVTMDEHDKLCKQYAKKM